MRRATLLLTALLPFSPAAAQTPPATAELPEMVVRAVRLDAVRNAISPTLGTNVLTLDRRAIENLPQGADAPLQELLLRAPGVVRDSFGEIHIRGEHRNLQYRVNGVTLPEGIQGFGAFLDARAVRSFSLLTGALPAQFGYRTGAVVDLTLRSGAADPGGWVSAYGGSRSSFQPSAGYAGIFGGWDVFATGTFRQTSQGIEPPTGSLNSVHNRSEQLRGLLSISRPIGDQYRLSVIAGASANRFQIPNVPGVPVAFPVLGAFDSATLRSRQWERNAFGIAALQGSAGEVDWQVAAFARQSSIHHLPSGTAELAFNGVSSDVRRRSVAGGIQADASWRAHPDHTLRFGLMSMVERSQAINRSTVLPLDADGESLDEPFVIGDRRSRTGWLHALYIQDEWRVTDRLTLNFGLRGDVADQAVRASQLSPRVNAVWRPLEGTTLTAGYARHFTPPAQELIAPDTLSRFAGTTAAPEIFRADLPRPERSHALSVAVSQRVLPRLTVGASGWLKFAEDMLDLGQFGRALVFTPFNYRDGRTRGVEVNAQWRGDSWDLFGSITHSRAEGRGIRSSQFNFEPEEIAYAARRYVRTDHDQALTASFGAGWRPWEGARLSATGYYGSGLRRGFANSEKMPDHVTFNLGFAQDVRLPDAGLWTARLDILNLTDRRVPLRDGSGIGVGAPQFLPRFAVLGGLARAF
ncbi:MAG: TonB-dependent receptor [Acetobacteraceae bacterium]|nr:TonB-dependent receptor [Acetobacteraceae bacterium]